MGLKRGAYDARRISEIIHVVIKHGMSGFIRDSGLLSHVPFIKRVSSKKYREDPHVGLRKIFEELGGTFVKLGQLLSIRPDLVPAEYCEELKKLQDDVHPFSFGEAKRIIEHELDSDIESVFKDFSKQPVAAASIGQVYVATLKKGNKKVAVKVQRPGIREKIESDIDIMYYFARKLEEHSKTIRKFSPVQIVKEFERYTKKELDYTYEAKNAEIFIQNFKRFPKLVIPKPYMHLTTEKVVVYEYIEGKKLNQLTKSDRSRKKFVLKVGMDVIVKMIFEDGFFHADIHPGNILVLPKGKIALLDFGIIGFLGKQLKDDAMELFVAVLNRDTENIAKVLMSVGEPSLDTDIEGFKNDIQEIINEWYGTRLSHVKVTHMLHRLFNSCVFHKIRMPVDLVLLGKAAVTMEGTCEEIDPDFDFVKTARPYINKILMKRITADKGFDDLTLKYKHIRDLITKVPVKAESLISKLEEGRLRVNVNDTEIKKLSVELDRSSNRIALGLIIAAFVIAGVLVPQNNSLPHYLGLSLVSWICFVITSIFLMIFFISVIREKK